MPKQRASTLFLAATTSLLLLSCGDDEAPVAPEPAPDDSPEESPPLPPGALAMVNGTPITQADVRARLGAGQDQNEEEDAEIPPERLRSILETLIREELTYQRAMELGLDDDPTYQERLQRMEAQVRSFARQELGQAFFRREIQDGAEVTEEELRAHFEEHAAELRTERHVYQLLRRNRAVVEAIHQEIEGGASFEEVAALQFPNVPTNARPPWDLGFLRWVQLPEPWREDLAGMSAGETSGVIEGPGGRFWIIHLVEERENPDVDFESSRTTLTNTLMVRKIEERRERIARELLEAARIVYAEGVDRGEAEQGEAEQGEAEQGEAEQGEAEQGEAG